METSVGRNGLIQWSKALKSAARGPGTQFAAERGLERRRPDAPLRGGTLPTGGRTSRQLPRGGEGHRESGGWSSEGRGRGGAEASVATREQRHRRPEWSGPLATGRGATDGQPQSRADDEAHAQSGRPGEGAWSRWTTAHSKGGPLRGETGAVSQEARRDAKEDHRRQRRWSTGARSAQQRQEGRATVLRGIKASQEEHAVTRSQLRMRGTLRRVQASRG